VEVNFEENLPWREICPSPLQRAVNALLRPRKYPSYVARILKVFH